MRATLAAILVAIATPALAEDHIQHAVCSPTTRTHATGVIGEALTISLPQGNTIYRVVQSKHPGEKDDDAAWTMPKQDDVKSDPLGQNLPMWPVRAGVTYMTIISHDGDVAHQHWCALRLEAVEASPEVTGSTYNLVFDRIQTTAAPAVVTQQPYTPQAAAYRSTVAHKRDAEAAERQKLADEAFNRDTCHYTAHGTLPSRIEPRCPMDDGQWTIMRFPGLTQKPAVYIVNGKNPEDDRLARQHQSGEFVVVEEIAEKFVLRLGDNVLEVINTKFDPAGRPGDSTGRQIIKASK